MLMRTIVSLLSCLACSSHCRRFQTAAERSEKNAQRSNHVKEFAALLYALNPYSQPQMREQFISRGGHSVKMEQGGVALLEPRVVSAPTTHSEVLIEKAKDMLYTKSGFYSNYDETAYSNEFVFRGPFIGPLNKKDYLNTMDAFGIWKAIPDINPNAWGFSIDPKDPNRVWFMVRNTGTFNGQPIAPGSINYKPNGATLDGCPETFSMLFDEEQKLKYLTVGYVADRFEGNTDGQGAAVGIFNAVGLPFPKVGPLQRFAQWFGTEVLALGPVSYSVDGVPDWWKDETVGSGGY